MKPDNFPFSEEIWNNIAAVRQAVIDTPKDEWSEELLQKIHSLTPIVNSKEYEDWCLEELLKTPVWKNPTGNKRRGSRVLKFMSNGWRRKRVSNH